MSEREAGHMGRPMRHTGRQAPDGHRGDSGEQLSDCVGATAAQQIKGASSAAAVWSTGGHCLSWAVSESQQTWWIGITLWPQPKAGSPSSTTEHFSFRPTPFQHPKKHNFKMIGCCDMCNGWATQPSASSPSLPFAGNSRFRWEPSRTGAVSYETMWITTDD